MADPFVSRAERVVDALLESDPEMALWAGDHRFDGRLPDYSTEAVAARVSMLREASHALAEVDPDDLDLADGVDLEIVAGQVSAQLFHLTELREHEWNPLQYNPGRLLNALLTRPTDTAEVRLTALIERLSAIPDSLATARGRLSDIPAVFAETGVGQFRGAAQLIRGRLSTLTDEVPHLRPAASAAADQAVTALTDFSDWLSRQPDGRSPRLGRALWEAKLWHSLDTPLSASELARRAEAMLTQVTDELAECAAQLLGEPASDDVTARALAKLAEDRPTNDTILPRSREVFAELSAFVREHDLVSLVDAPLDIVEMPEFARGVSAAYVDPPGALETASVPTFYAISPAPADWSDERTASFFAEYNDHMLRNLTVHEAMPGHYLQLAHARRYRGRTRVRQTCFSGTFIEGWAVYAEELLQSYGYGGLPVRMQQLKMRLRMIINVLLDQSIHCDGMTEEEALHLMVGRGHQSQEEAEGKWARARLSSTQLSTYFVGYQEVSRLAAACPRGRADRAWHDEILSHGSIAPRHVATLLGV
ncbi:uncharacterized protein (DUF885 family) [Stackebrandtia endophytica]|uniref:Uncharacterized protein (DUF885 family) n=1 Tax=Stackebrandtia endophytica TaxID=1496996 RepID=A0A543AUI4_9ACTN|nr:DUF885 domain-containing protein [Stackebrandtia endophytica]TQL76215.1 uncharacterized protein (DUF885 family) [Stackebrandtia endophytica]